MVLGKTREFCLQDSFEWNGYRFARHCRFDNNFKMLKRKGTLVSFGNASGVIPDVSLFKLTGNVKLVRPTMGNYLVTPEEGSFYSNRFFEVVSKGIVKINVSEEYPFTAEGVRQAQTDLPSGKTKGKLIIKIGN